MGEETSIPVEVIIALAVIATTILLGIKFWPVIKDYLAGFIARLADIVFGGGGGGFSGAG